MLKTMRREGVVLIAAALLAVAGCSKPNPIIGKWRATAPGGMPGAPQQVVDLVFDDKGDEKMSQQIQGITLSIDSSYKAENGQLTQTLKTATIGGVTKTGSGQTKTFQYTIDGDTLTLQGMMGRGSNMVFNRIKE